jgi:hypothetical protein
MAPTNREADTGLILYSSHINQSGKALTQPNRPSIISTEPQFQCGMNLLVFCDSANLLCQAAPCPPR